MRNEEESARWQPVLLIAQHRIECGCGSLATIFVQQEEEDGKPAYYWVPCCQPCWEKAIEEVEA